MNASDFEKAFRVFPVHELRDLRRRLYSVLRRSRFDAAPKVGECAEADAVKILNAIGAEMGRRGL